MKTLETVITPTALRNNPPKVKLELLKSRLSVVREIAESCRLCPRVCLVNRWSGEPGTCKIGAFPKYSSVNLHHGEEPPISGYRGSGTIFLTGCNLRCIFCQNFPISQLGHGVVVTVEELTRQILWLQEKQAHNINFVTPTPQAHLIFEALIAAYQEGLQIPLVYNSGGYESIEMLKAWDGIIDIYMPDAKYGDDSNAERLSNAPNYVKHNRTALIEMHRQVGDLKVDKDGSAISGLLVRHLVLPGNAAGSDKVFKFISEEISNNTYISLMSQYFPAWRAVSNKPLDRRLTREEYHAAVDSLHKYRLENGWTQPYQGID